MQPRRLFYIAALLPGVAFAQEIREQRMDSVKVKGTLPQRQIQRSAFTGTSVSTAQLKNSTADVSDALNNVTGVRVLEDGGLGSGTNFSLNGFSGNQVKFFLDGIPMDSYSSSYGLSTMPVNAVERIDVYKGVVPVELGTDALGGVVNIITNRKKNFADLSYTFGSFNTHRVSANGAFTNREGFTLRGSANYNYSDNDYKVYVPIVRNNQVQYFADVPRFHDRYRGANVRAEAGWTGKSFADMLLLGIIASKDDKQVQNGSTMEKVFGGITTNSQTISPTLKFAKKNLFLNGLDVNFYAAYNISTSHVDDKLLGVTYNWLGETTVDPNSNLGELSRTETKLDDKEFDTGLNIAYKILEGHSVSANYNFSHFHREVFDRLNPDRIENQFPKTLSKGIFGLAYKIATANWWNATAFTKFYAIDAKGEKLYDFGLPTQRTDEFKSDKTGTGYGAAATVFPLHNLQFKLSYEKAYRMPTSEEIFGDGLFVRSNPNLKPEKSSNLNAGLGYEFDIAASHRVLLSGSFLYRNATDLILRMATIASPMTSYANISETRTLAAEGSLGYRYRDTFHLDASVTFQDITDQAEQVYVDSYNNPGYQTNYQKGFRIPNVPYFFANASAGYSFKDLIGKDSTLDFGLHFNYVENYFLTWAELGAKDSKKVIPTQTSWDAEVAYTAKGGRYNVGLEAKNMTNEKLYDRYYLQKPGRAFFLKLRYTL